MMAIAKVMQMARWRAALLVGLLGGCQVPVRASAPLNPPATLPTTAQAGASAVVPIEEPGAVRLQVVLRGPDGLAIRALAHLTELTTGAYVGLRLQSEGAGALWIYAYHRTRNGKLESLSNEPVLVPLGTTYELPGNGLWFQLQGPATKEVFYAIASRTPLGAQLADTLAKLPDDREPPPITNTRNRFPGPVYRRTLDNQGAAILVVSLLHAPPPS